MAATQPKPAKNVLREMEQVGVMENANGVPTRTNVDKEGSLALEVWIIHVGIDIQGRVYTQFGKHGLFRQDLGAAEKIFSRGGGGNGKNQGRQGRHYDDLVGPGAAFWPRLSKGGTC